VVLNQCRLLRSPCRGEIRRRGVPILVPTRARLNGAPIQEHVDPLLGPPAVQGAKAPADDGTYTPMTSWRQWQANRLNALKSTGPRTEEGKRVSRRRHRPFGGGVAEASPAFVLDPDGSYARKHRLPRETLRQPLPRTVQPVPAGRVRWVRSTERLLRAQATYSY
jgi:hypothetical protein